MAQEDRKLYGDIQIPGDFSKRERWVEHLRYAQFT